MGWSRGSWLDPVSIPGYSNFLKKEGLRPSDVKHETNVGERGKWTLGGRG